MVNTHFYLDPSRLRDLWHQPNILWESSHWNFGREVSQQLVVLLHGGIWRRDSVYWKGRGKGGRGNREWLSEGTSWQLQGRRKWLFHSLHRKTKLGSLSWPHSDDKVEWGTLLKQSEFSSTDSKCEKRPFVGYWCSCLEWVFNNSFSSNVKLQETSIHY